MHGNQSWELQRPVCVLNVNVGTAQGARTPEAGFLRPEFRPLLADDNTQGFLFMYGFVHEHAKRSAVLSLRWIGPLLSGGPSNFLSLGSRTDSFSPAHPSRVALAEDPRHRATPSCWDSRWLHHHCGWEPHVPAELGGEALTWD